MRLRVWWAALALVAGCADFVGTGEDSGAGTDTSASGSGTSGPSGTTNDPTQGTGTSASSTDPTLGTTSTTDPTEGETDPTVGETDPTTDTDTTSTTDPTDGSSSSGEPPPPSCSNDMLDGDETDVDCGGACDPCGLGDDCQGAGDCETGFCADDSTCDLQDPTVWLDGLDAETLYNDIECNQSPPTPGQQVYCWDNKGSEGGFFVAGNDQPLYREALDGLEFDDNPLASEADIFGGNLGDVTVFLYQEEVAVRNSFDFNLNHPNEDSTRYSAHVPFGNPNRRLVWDIGGTSGAARVRSGSNPFPEETDHLFTFVNSANEDVRAIRLDGNELVSEGGARNESAGTVSIGSNARSIVYEFRVYSPSPSPVHRALIEGQMACRWDIRNLLPMDHPFHADEGGDDEGCPPTLE